MNQAPANSIVRFWWPTHVLMRRYPAAADVAAHLLALDAGRDVSLPAVAEANDNVKAFIQWLEHAAAALAHVTLQRGANLPTLRLDAKRIAVAPSGQVPRRAPAAMFAGLYCIDPGTIDAQLPEGGCITFLDPRMATEMIPGSSAPSLTDRVMRPAAGQLILFPGWLQQGHTAPVPPQHPAWLGLRFRPVLSAAKSGAP